MRESAFLYITRSNRHAVGLYLAPDRCVRIISSESVCVDCDLPQERKGASWFALNGPPASVASWAWASFFARRSARDDDDEPLEQVKLQVICVSRPLVGGICAPDEDDELDSAAVARCVAKLRCEPELEGPFRELDAFAADVALVAQLRPRDGLDQIEPSLEAACFKMWRRAVDALLSSGGAAALGLRGDVVARQRLSQVVESYLMRSLHGVVYPWVARRCAVAERRFASALAECRRGERPVAAAIHGSAPLTATLAEVLSLRTATSTRSQRLNSQGAMVRNSYI